MDAITGAYTTFAQARTMADRYARVHEETMYVVYEAGEFFVATNEDLETFFVGLSDNQIRYATEF